MNRYIRFQERFLSTKRISTYYIDACNNCPLMFTNRNISYCKCLVFRSETHNNIIKSFVSKKEDKGRIKLEIPNWCKLPKSLDELNKTEKYYIVNNGIVVLSYKPGIISSDIINNTFSADFYDDDDDELFDSIIKNSFEPMDDDDSLNDVKEYYTIDKPCSLCGQYKPDVNRFTNNGMCTECYNKYKDDVTSLKCAFINNFRLKRQIKTSNNNYKMI